MSNDLIWQDPPRKQATGNPGVPRAWTAEATALRANPTRWALLKTFTSGPRAASFACQARKGAKQAFQPVAEWEWRSSGCDVFVRYVPPVTEGDRP